MKKLFVLVLILSVFCTAQAGYLIRSVLVGGNPTALRNHTLTFDGDDIPIAAATVPNLSPVGQSIVIVGAYDLFARVFHVPAGSAAIEVRDFHYVNGAYILCGAIGTGTSARAFVATINGTLSSMRLMAYSDANIFYSIWGDDPLSNFYVCGKKDNDGVIASVNRTTLNLTALRKTTDWEYHKIILKGGISPRFVVSGRDPDCEYIGYAEFSPLSFTPRGYRWEQNTESLSLCVVGGNNVLVPDQVILASSWNNIVTLTPIHFSVGIVPISYHFTSSSDVEKYWVQDILITETNDNILISVAGFMRTPTQHQAWYGGVTGYLSAASTMDNNNYISTSPTGSYEHHKVRYNNIGETYTGGWSRDYNSGGTLFGTPRTNAPYCDNPYPVPSSSAAYRPTPMSVFSVPLLQPTPFPTLTSNPYQTSPNECPPFKSEPPTPKAIPTEDESEIIAFPDRITLSDIPANTNYQIYNVIGQLIQTGVTTPDISTANLSKGVYILRLENGKAFKFVK